MAHVLLRHREIPDLHKLEVYRQHGGYEGLKKALSTCPLAYRLRASIRWEGTFRKYLMASN